ncbi:hypothetical protein ACFLWV_03795 [Chloroflexota bacterium]
MLNIPCEAFQKNPDGSWSCVRPVTISGPSGQIQIGPGMSFNRGVLFMGVDLATLLDENCT